MTELSAVRQWEYRVWFGVGTDMEKALTALGRHGWELVTVAVQHTNHYAYLKREKLCHDR